MKKNMKDVFENQPLSGEAPQGLRNKVEFAARQKARAPRFGLGTRWIAVGTAAAAFGFFAVTSLIPAKAEAKTWETVSTAYKNVKGMLMRINFAGNSERGDVLIANKGQDWRVSINGMGEKTMDVSYAGGEITFWDGGGTAQVMNLGMQIPFSPEDMVKAISEEMSVAKLLKMGADEIGRENIVVEQPVMVDGRRIYNVTVERIEGGGRVYMVVDADTDLPVSISMQSGRGESVEMSFEFNADFDDSFLQPVLPSGIKFEQMDIGNMSGIGEGMFHDFDFVRKVDEHRDRHFDNDKDSTVVTDKVEIKGSSVVR